LSSVGLLVRQLEEKADKIRELAQPLTGRQLLVSVRRLAQDPRTWRGDIKTAFGGWLDAIDGWIGNCLGGPLVDLATRIDHRVTEINDLSRYARIGMCPAPPRPMQPIRSEPGGLPHFELQLPRPPREPVSMTPDAMRTLAKALSAAHEAIKAHERKVRDALAPVVMPTAEPGIELGPASAHLPPDAAAAVGHPKWYLVAAVELDRARAEILNRATKWEDASRAIEGVTPTLAGVFSPLEALKARAVQRAATGRSSAFALPATKGPPAPAPAPPTPREQRRKAESDARRIMKRLRSGFLHIPDRKGANEILSRAAKRAATSPEYAEAFLKKLGPKGLRKLIDEGLDLCLVSEVVARASVAGVSVQFLKETLGKNPFDKPERAAQLAGCVCPNGTFHPAWVEHLLTTLYQAPDTKPADPADPRERYRRQAAVVIREHLARPPRGMEIEADDVLEGVIAYGANHELDPSGKRALATALAARGLFDDIARVSNPGSLSQDAAGTKSFNPLRGDLILVLPDLLADPEARRIVLGAAEAYAAAQIAIAANGPPEGRDRNMKEVGALFGVLTSKPYSAQAAVDIRRAVEKSVVGLLAAAGGKLIEAAKVAPVVSLALEGGKAILFDVAGESSDLRAKERELEGEREKVSQQENLRAGLQAEIEHLVYAAILSDPARRADLHFRLSPADLPRLTSKEMADLGLGKLTREEWQRALFDDEGRLRVPKPSDGRRWTMFQRWAEKVNPTLNKEATTLTEKAFNAMTSVGER